jgi:hypothetical protein
LSVSVTSSIRDGERLDVARPWRARVVSSSPVSRVDFFIDGSLTWTERNPPYFFNDDGNLLPPWLLGRGTHTLTVTATTLSRDRASATAHVTVKATSTAPRALLATYRRTVTASDFAATSSLPGYDPAALPPTGAWTIQFRRNHLISLGDPTNPAGENESYTANAAGALTLSGPANWLTPPELRGGLCEPAPADQFHWAVQGQVLTITGGSNCPNRKALFDGTWTRRHG